MATSRPSTDSISHRFFAHPEMVVDLLRGFLPPDILAELDQFGSTPDWVTEKVRSANLEWIEIWSDNFVFANSVDELFAA